jgi:pilus assembly protein CpaE
MPRQILNIALEIKREALDSQVLEALGTLPHAQVTMCQDLTLDAEVEKQDGRPDILIIDDRPEEIDTVSRLRKLKDLYADAEIFVVSTDHRPQHIVNLMKAGAGEYLSNPLNVVQLTDAIEEVRIKKANAGQVTQGTMYSFVGSKGGLGSTVIAVNAAAALAGKSRQSVLLCDMSLQSGDASVLLDVPPGPTVIDLSRNIHRLDVSLFRGAVTHHRTGIDFLAAPHDPEEGSDVNADQTSQILALANKLYDHVLVDCPSMSLDVCTLTVLHASEKIFIVTDLSVTAVRNASRFCNLIQKIGISPSRINFVINRYIKGSTLSIEEVEATLEKSVFWLFPNDFSQVVSSINRGVPLVKFQPNAPLSKNITEFVEKMQNSAAYGAYRGLKGTFGKAI